MASVESITASIPGPRPPTQVLIRTTAKNSYHGGATIRCCNSSATSNAATTQNTASPYLGTADGSHRSEVSSADIPLPPLVGLVGECGSRHCEENSAPLYHTL